MGITAYDAIVLAGGAARRLGGVDKPALRVGGATLLDRVLDACSGADHTVVVGPRRPTSRPVLWTREDPPGGGPLPALDAGLRLTKAQTVLVFAADLPFLGSETAADLLTALDTASRESARDVDGVLLVDADGRDQPLAAVYRSESLGHQLAVLAAEHGNLSNLPLRLLTGELVLDRLPDSGGRASFDCDTWEDLFTARTRIREHGVVLEEWISVAKAELGIDLDVDVAALLELAADAAHGVARPAAPLTTFLVGYAAGRAGGGPEAVATATRTAAALAQRWAAEEAGKGEPDPGDPAA